MHLWDYSEWINVELVCWVKRIVLCKGVMPPLLSWMPRQNGNVDSPAPLLKCRWSFLTVLELDILSHFTLCDISCSLGLKLSALQPGASMLHFWLFQVFGFRPYSVMILEKAVRTVTITGPLNCITGLYCRFLTSMLRTDPKFPILSRDFQERELHQYIYITLRSLKINLTELNLPSWKKLLEATSNSRRNLPPTLRMVSQSPLHLILITAGPQHWLEPTRHLASVLLESTAWLSVEIKDSSFGPVGVPTCQLSWV